MKGRKVGSTIITLQEINQIVKLTQEKKSRPDIAKEVHKSPSTVWHYQKRFGLI